MRHAPNRLTWLQRFRYDPSHEIGCTIAKTAMWVAAWAMRFATGGRR